jgi:REP element-mobilizing transposase RayT
MIAPTGPFLVVFLWERHLAAMILTMKPPKGSHNLRSGRVSIESQAYFITTATHERIPLFIDPAAAGIVLDSLKWLDQQGKMVLDAAVLMPDHLHCVAELKTDGLPIFMHSLKSYTAKKVNAVLKRQGSFWQDQYYEHAIRKDEDLMEVVLYILNNPVRAGLVKDFHDYPFWYCRWSV